MRRTQLLQIFDANCCCQNALRSMQNFNMRYGASLSESQIRHHSVIQRLTSCRLSLHSVYSVFVSHKSIRAWPGWYSWDYASARVLYSPQFLCFPVPTAIPKVDIWSECHGSTIHLPMRGVCAYCEHLYAVSHKSVFIIFSPRQYCLVLS
jgi:hypothetical protein